jgi:competence protein ComEC
VTFMDVGQGDAILVEFPKGTKMSIDGGGLYDDRFDIGKQVIAPVLWNKKIRRLDHVVLTHPDPDHVKGLNFILSHFSVDQFWESGFPSQSEPYLELEKTLWEKRIPRLSQNESGSSPPEIAGVRLSVLNPALPAGPGFPRGPANNQSLVLKLDFKNVTILLTGDIEREAEYRILRAGHSVRAKVMKVPHHGSFSSSSEAFLDQVKPVYAILSVGERRVGRLPHPEVLKRYEERGIRIFRTDRDGAVTVTTDGEGIDVQTYLRGAQTTIDGR